MQIVTVDWMKAVYVFTIDGTLKRHTKFSLIKYLRSVHQRAHWTVNTFDMGRASLVTVKTCEKEKRKKKHLPGTNTDVKKKKRKIKIHHSRLTPMVTIL